MFQSQSHPNGISHNQTLSFVQYSARSITSDSPATPISRLTDSNDELTAILRAKLIGGEATSSTPLAPNCGSTPATPNGRKQQRAVSMNNAEQLLSEGWTFVTKFGADRVLLQAPGA